MPSKIKRISSMLMAVLMIVSMLGSLSLAEKAESDTEYEYTKPYVLTFMGENIPEEYQDYQSVWFSPHRSHFYNAETNETEDPWSNILALYSYETKELIPAYCLDLITGGESGSAYRRLNLEDAGYYTKNDAGRLRAIVNASFPKIQDTKTIQEAANEWLETNGKGQIVDLTGAEALSAAQYAIWSIANQGDGFLLEDSTPYAGTTLQDTWAHLVMFPGEAGSPTIKNGYENDLRNKLVNMLEAERKDEDGNSITASNINLLSEYLLNLEPQKAENVVISNASFNNAEVNFTKNEDDIYTATVTVEIDATIGADDELELTVKYGDKSNTVKLTGAGSTTITLSGLPAAAEKDNLTLEINGYQNAGDVFMFDAVDNRGSSQTLIAYDASRLPVHAEIEVGNQERKIHIYKYGPTTDSGEAGDGTEVNNLSNKKPIANVEFAIYWVGTAEEVAENGVKEASTYINLENWITTVKTDDLGYACYNFSKNGQLDGVYLVVEKRSAAVSEAAEPFFVSVPLTNPAGDGWLYDIYVYPKNDIKDDVVVDKDVTEIGNKEDTADVDEPVKWIISGSIPAGMYDNTESGKVYAQEYKITDTLDYRLTYETGSLIVKLYNKAGEEISLTADTDYKLTVKGKTVIVEGKEYATTELIIELTEAGIKKVVANLGTGEETPEIRVEFNAPINSNAELGKEIYNDATVDFTNYAGWAYTDNVDEQPHVHTGGLNILKHAKGDETELLSGAKFKLARVATDAEIADESVKTETLNVGGTALTVVYVDFYADAEMTEEKVCEVTTGEDGTAIIYGLAYGKYYLVETQAPENYNKLSKPVSVEINATSHQVDAPETDVDEGVYVKVANSKKFLLPETGGMGTTIFTVVGCLLIFVAGSVLIVSRKSRRR